MGDFGNESLFLLKSEENRERVSHTHTNNCWKQNKVIKIKDVLCFSIVTIGRNIHRNKIYQIKAMITVSEKTTTTNDNSNIIYTTTITTELSIINNFDKKTNINNKINDNNTN